MWLVFRMNHRRPTPGRWFDRRLTGMDGGGGGGGDGSEGGAVIRHTEVTRQRRRSLPQM